MVRPTATAAAALAPTAARILDAAEQAFAVSGFAGARLEDIAAAVGIRRPSLLHHYATKDDLYAAVVSRAFADLSQALAGAMRPAGRGRLAEQVEGLVGGYLAFLAARPAFAGLVLREVIDGRGPGRELLAREVAPLLDAVERVVQRGRAGVRPRVPVRAAILQVACAPLVRAASGPLGPRLWGPAPDATTALARALLLPDEGDVDPTAARRTR